MSNKVKPKEVSFDLTSNFDTKSINFAEIISNLIEREISLTAKNRFDNLRDIQFAISHPADIQRIIINKAIMIELLKWRAFNNHPVYDVIGFLHNDGELEEWTYNFVLYVIPFLRKYNILGV